MLNVRLAVAGDVCDGVGLCCPVSNEMSWMRSGTYLSQFLRIFLPTFAKSEDLETWPNHIIVNFLTRIRSVSYLPVAADLSANLLIGNIVLV